MAAHCHGLDPQHALLHLSAMFAAGWVQIVEMGQPYLGPTTSEDELGGIGARLCCLASMVASVRAGIVETGPLCLVFAVALEGVWAVGARRPCLAATASSRG